MAETVNAMRLFLFGCLASTTANRDRPRVDGHLASELANQVVGRADERL
jgi:hypothetical protein